MESRNIRTVNNKTYFGNTEVDTESVGMFTGFHDENGKPVFEGDIVSGQHRYGVVWDVPLGCFKLMRRGELYQCSEFAVKMKCVVGTLYELKTERERMYFYGKEE